MHSDKEIARRVEAYPWAAETAKKLEKDLAAFADAGWTIPEPFPLSRWSHEYQCSDCSSRLNWHYGAPRTHTCPNCGTVETDDRYHEAWLTLLNLNQITAANVMIALAKAGRLTDGYSRAAELLLGYARQYSQYVEHGRAAGTGKLQPQSLDEAVWMLQATDLFEVLTDAGALEGEGRQRVIDNLFTPAIPLLRRQTGGVHNIHTWKASAIASLALATQNENAFRFAQRVLQKNASEGVLASGLWYEIAPGYHYYTLQAFLSYERTMRHYGRESGIEGTLYAMLDVPLSMMLSDGRFPAINDSSDHRIVNYGAIYEKATGLLGISDSALSTLCNKLGYQRDNVEALLYGPAEISSPPGAPPRLSITEGVVVMQRKDIEAALKCSSPADGHDHPDRLTLNLYFPGRSICAADLGAVGYSNPLHGGFLKRTESHNTVMVDGMQLPIVNTQRISKSYDVGEALVVTGHYDQAYPGVMFWRKIVLGDGWCLDWTSCSSKEEHLYQWLFHVNAPICSETGEALVIPDGADALIDNSYVRKQRIIGENVFRGAWIHETGDVLKVQSRLQANAPGDVAVFESPGLPTTSTRNALLMQSRGAAFDLITLLSLNDACGPQYTCDVDALRFSISGRDFLLERLGALVPLNPAPDMGKA